MPRFLPVIVGVHWSAEQEKSVFDAGRSCSSYAVACEVCCPGTPGVPWRSLCLVKAKLTGVAPPPDIENIKSEWGSARADMNAIERMRISPAGAES
jgi:hypothetical protein